MPKNLKEIKPLPPNSTAIMVSPMENIVRTGTLNGDSSFLHALLTAYSKKYREMSEDQRLQYISELRKQISKDFSFDKWLNFDEDNITKIKEKVRDIFIKISNFISGKIHDSKLSEDILKVVTTIVYPYKDYFESIFEIVPIKTIDKTLLPESYNDFDIGGHKKQNFKDTVTDSLSTKFKKILDETPDIQHV